MEILLTLIIPYYETYELTLKLLKELDLQNDNQVEVILIDDYCKQEFHDYKMKNLKLIEHTTNKGVAKSRNEGIDIAKGEYIGFLDCDDQVTLDYIEILLNAIYDNHTDVINFNWLDLSENIVNRKPHNYAPWKAIYRKEVMPKFREDKDYGSEDVDFQQNIEEGNYSIIYLDRVLYIYNSNREGSLYWKKTHREND